MSLLVAPGIVNSVLVLAIPLLISRLIVVIILTPALQPGRRNMYVLIHLPRLRLLRVLGRVFANRGHVPRPAKWRVVLRHTGRFGSRGAPILG